MTLKGDFIVLDLDDSYDNTSSTFVSCFDSNFESVSGMLNLVMWAKTEKVG